MSRTSLREQGYCVGSFWLSADKATVNPITTKVGLTDKGT